MFGNVYKGFKLQIDSLKSAQNLINVIATQGEGAPAEGDIPTEYDPCYDPSSGDLNIADADNLENTTGHYERLLKIKKQGIPATYPELSGANASEQQQALNTAYQGFLSDLQKIFSSTEDSDDLFNNMWSLIGLVQAVWQAGACPEFKVS